jgi:hypothetical protein
LGECFFHFVFSYFPIWFIAEIVRTIASPVATSNAFGIPMFLFFLFVVVV